MRELPEQFCESMQKLLGEEYDAYRECLEQTSCTAVRINTNKITVENWDRIRPFSGARVPWTEKGYYYDADQVQPSKHPYYYAGLFYIQEPSAMIPASLLPVSPGDKVLDLCAAPGGKATELAAKLHGEGILVANDISVSRTMSLAKNLQTAGVVNAVVTAEEPEHLAEYFPSFFNAVLIDAPCSGEGMFRRDPHMIRDWLEHGPQYYAEIQRQILASAYQMLSPGGYMVYSTCTFSPIENEAMISWFLSEHSDMQICPVQRQPMFAEGISQWADGCGEEALHQAVRIFPHRAQGEGHFAVLLQKKIPEHQTPDPQERSVSDNRGCEISDHRSYRVGNDWNPSDSSGKNRARTKRKSQKEHSEMDPLLEAERWLEYLQINGGAVGYRQRLCQKRNQIILMPEGMTDIGGLRLIQNGLIVGTMEKGRFEPSPQLALAVQNTTNVSTVSLASGDIRVIKYLKGETIDSPDVTNTEKLADMNHYVLVCVDGFPLGWAKWMKGGRLKNKYYAGWRMK